MRLVVAIQIVGIIIAILRQRNVMSLLHANKMDKLVHKTVIAAQITVTLSSARPILFVVLLGISVSKIATVVRIIAQHRQRRVRRARAAKKQMRAAPKTRTAVSMFAVMESVFHHRPVKLLGSHVLPPQTVVLAVVLAVSVDSRRANKSSRCVHKIASVVLAFVRAGCAKLVEEEAALARTIKIVVLEHVQMGRVRSLYVACLTRAVRVILRAVQTSV